MTKMDKNELKKKLKKLLQMLIGSQQALLIVKKNIQPWKVPIPARHCSVLIGIK